MKHPILDNFFVLEGIDGSGTTTQLNSLAQYACDHDIRLFTSCEPTGSPIGKTIRLLLKGDYMVSQETMARLFSADRCNHLDNPDDGIHSYLEKGFKVLTDRYLFSSLVYQSIDFDFEKVLAFNRFPLPQILFYIDTPPELGIRRRTTREIEEIYEKAALQHQIYDAYNMVLEHFAHSGMNIVRIDGSRSPDEISTEIWSYLV